MNLEDKKKELRELNKITFPNDQEYTRIEQLENDIALEYDEAFPKEIEEPTQGKRTVFEYVADKIKEKQGKPIEQRNEKRKNVLQSIGNVIINAVKEKPVTDAELYELKRKVVKYRLKADIAKSKAIINKSKTGKMATLEKLFMDDHSSKKRTPRTSFEKYDDNKEVIQYRRKILGY